jgi:hypothetical protein
VLAHPVFSKSSRLPPLGKNLSKCTENAEEEDGKNTESSPEVIKVVHQVSSFKEAE